MKKLMSYQEFRSGAIYNSVYIGPNEDYAAVNGKKTFQVIATEPTLQVQVLFDRRPLLHTDDLRDGGISTVSSPEEAFRERELFEPKDETEWFKKSVKVASLGEALEGGFIARERIENKVLPVLWFVANWEDEVHGIPFFVSCEFEVEGVPANPYLQVVIITWKDWDEVNADFARYGSKVK